MFFLNKKCQCILQDGLIILLLVLLTSCISAQHPSSVWFIKAGANGDGKSLESPLGSTTDLEEVSQPSDLIIILAGAELLDGGIALKEGQTLIGLPQAGLKPVLTNTSADRNGGNGIVLAGDNRITNIRIENTHASGIIGQNVSGNRLEAVEVFGANQSATTSNFDIPALGKIAHGGIIIVSSGNGMSVVNYIIESEIVDATAISIGSVVGEGSTGRLVINETRVEDGTALNRLDMGIIGTAEGPGAQLDLEIDNCKVSGRSGRGGRNILVMSARDGRATALIERSIIGASGQDGVLAVATNIPSQVHLDIRESVIENAGQTNVEGTILNLPASDPARAKETDMSIRMENSIIRNAGVDSKFEEGDTIGFGNIWMGSSALAQQINPESTVPFAPGNYRLTLRNCEVSSAKNFGLGFGNVWQGLAPEQSSYEVLLQNSRIMDNGPTEIMIAAPGANIDARGNCWGKMEELLEDRIRLLNTAQIQQLDASAPLNCEHQ